MLHSTDAKGTRKGAGEKGSNLDQSQGVNLHVTSSAALGRVATLSATPQKPRRLVGRPVAAVMRERCYRR